MQEFIAAKELSDTDHIPEKANVNEVTPTPEDELSVVPVDVTNDGKHEESKPKNTFKKGTTLRLDGPISGVCSLEKGAAYVGLTKIALRTAIQRNQMPGHKTRTNPEDEESDGTWWFNAKEWDKLADELPECEPPEWHNWKSYWTYDRRKRKFNPANKEECKVIKGRRVHTGRKSKLEQAKNNDTSK
ncbi:transcriptional regulator [Salmonella enterica]|nr:transcriptional regulator [Salmonella enterica]EDX6796338.1 transcriptional regulator [Salmonella enterica subsp. enterica serovar Sandiego]EMC1696078.1 transcriptional regulator [Salmonella enterica]